MYRPRWVSYNEAGDHFYSRQDGNIVSIRKADLAEGEACRVSLELLSPAYDPEWSYKWYRLGQELRARQWVESLSPDERQRLLEEAHGNE